MKNTVRVIIGREMKEMVFRMLKFTVATRTERIKIESTDNPLFSKPNDVRLSTIPVSVPIYAPIVASKIASIEINFTIKIPLLCDANDRASKLLFRNDR